MITLKSRTSYLVDNAKEVIEIKKQCEKQGLALHILPEDHDSVGVIYIHDLEEGFIKTGWNPIDNSNPYPNYNTVKWSDVMNYPTFDFKINLSNMSEAEKEVAKKWLVQVVDTRGSGRKSNVNKSNLLFVFDTRGGLDNPSIEWVADTKVDYFDEYRLPELFLTFSKPTITSWEAPSKKSEKELQLEELVGKLQQQLKEAEQQLENLK